MLRTPNLQGHLLDASQMLYELHSQIGLLNVFTDRDDTVAPQDEGVVVRQACGEILKLRLGSGQCGAGAKITAAGTGGNLGNQRGGNGN